MRLVCGIAATRVGGGEDLGVSPDTPVFAGGDVDDDGAMSGLRPKTVGGAGSNLWRGGDFAGGRLEHLGAIEGLNFESRIRSFLVGQCLFRGDFGDSCLRRQCTRECAAGRHCCDMDGR